MGKGMAPGPNTEQRGSTHLALLAKLPQLSQLVPPEVMGERPAARHFQWAFSWAAWRVLQAAQEILQDQHDSRVNFLERVALDKLGCHTYKS